MRDMTDFAMVIVAIIAILIVFFAANVPPEKAAPKPERPGPVRLI